MARPSTLDLWKALTGEERQQACRDYLADKSSNLEDCGEQYARHTRMRATFWRQKKAEERASDLARVLHVPDFKSYRAEALKSYLLTSKNKLLSDFLNALGISHENGRFEKADPPSPEKIQSATQVIQPKHSAKDCWLYFGFLLTHDNKGIWKNLQIAFDPIDLAIQAAVSGKIEEAEAHPPVAAAPTPNPLPELPDEFSTLDELIVKSIISTANNTEGAFTRQRIDDLVDEIVSLNGDRRRSYFHRGFFHALFDVGFEFSFAAENHERRSWYMAGALLGLLRQGIVSREAAGGRRFVEDVIKAQRAIVEELVIDGRLGCGKLVARSLYPHLIAVDEVTLASKMVEVQGPRLTNESRLSLLCEVLADGAAFLRIGKLGEAMLLLSVAHAGLSDPVKIASGDAEFESSYRQALRKMGQCHQALGNYPEAKKYLEMVTELRDCEERREALTDLGLIAAGFKSLRSILPSKDPVGWPILATSLLAGKELFDQAIVNVDGEEVRGIRNAHFALGLSCILGNSPKPGAAVAHFERAYAGMLRRREAYVVGNVLEWTRFLLALSHLEQLDSAFVSKARELVEESTSVGDQFPIELWRRCLDAAAMLDDGTLCQRIVDYIFEKRTNEAFGTIKGSSALLRSEGLRRRYSEMLATDNRLSISERFGEWKSLLEICQREGDPELAADILSQLEDFALSESPLCAQFEALLASPKGYSPGWDSDDAEMARARALESIGRLADAGSIYALRFYALAEKGSEHCLVQARELLDKVKRLGGENGVADMESRLAACEGALGVEETNAGAEAELKSGAKVALLYVGGNETQESFDEKIRDELVADYPGLTVEFAHPGWSSNWNRELEVVKRMVPRANAVVISPLVRTQFGRNLRKFCDAAHPWFGSTAKGQSGIRESLRRVAITVINRRKTKPTAA